MTARFTFRRDSAGIAQFLQSAPVAREISARAAAVAATAAAMVPADVDIVVDDYRTDRAASSVTIRDARGRLYQVRDGVLTRAAAGTGLEVTHR